jgi:hypothetical protein
LTNGKPPPLNLHNLIHLAYLDYSYFILAWGGVSTMLLFQVWDILDRANKLESNSCLKINIKTFKLVCEAAKIQLKVNPKITYHHDD